MRRTLLAVMAVAVIAGMTVSAQAGTTLTFPITVTFNADSINLSVTGTPLATWGQVGPSTNNFSNQAAGEIRHTVTQNGWAKIDFNALATCATGWTLASTIGGNTAANTCVVAGIFTGATVEDPVPAGRVLVLADFGNEDVLGSTAIQASATVLARNDSNPDPDDTPAIKGYSVPDVPGGYTTRSARYLLQAPPSVSGAGTAQQTITIVIGAVAI